MANISDEIDNERNPCGISRSSGPENCQRFGFGFSETTQRNIYRFDPNLEYGFISQRSSIMSEINVA